MCQIKWTKPDSIARNLHTLILLSSLIPLSLYDQNIFASIIQLQSLFLQTMIAYNVVSIKKKQVPIHLILSSFAISTFVWMTVEYIGYQGGDDEIQKKWLLCAVVLLGLNVVMFLLPMINYCWSSISYFSGD